LQRLPEIAVFSLLRRSFLISRLASEGERESFAVSAVHFAGIGRNKYRAVVPKRFRLLRLLFWNRLAAVLAGTVSKSRVKSPRTF
jgi:hypothetical protein